MDPSQLSNRTFLETTPAGMPPPGVVPNFVDPENRAYVGFASMSVLLALAVIALFVRFWIRLVIQRTPGWDDFFALLAGITLIFETGFSFALFHQFVGRHIWDVPLIALFDKGVQSAQTATQLLNPFTSLFFKLVILIFLLRIFPYRNDRITASCAYLGIAVVTLFNVASLIVFWYQCIPRSGTNGQAPQMCMTSDMPAATNVFNAIIDVYIFLFPLPAILGLRLSRKRKMGIIIIFATGFATCACSVLTCVYRFKYSKNPDATWYALPQIIGAAAEQATGVIVGAMPCFSAVARHISVVRNTRGYEGVLSDAKFLLTGRASSARQSRASSLKSGQSSNNEIKEVRQVTVQSIPKDTEQVENYEFDRVAPYQSGPRDGSHV